MLRPVMVILWPSFLAAIIAEGLFFSMFEPDDLFALLGWADAPAMAAYTIGFFCFWLVCSVASLLTYYLVTVPDTTQQPRTSL